MTTVTAALLAAAICLVLLAKFLERAREPECQVDADTPWPYTLHPVLTVPEQALHRRLRAALPDLAVFAQVQVSRVLRVDESRADAVSWRNRVSQLSFDFLVCSPDGDPLLAIELDDSSHDRPSRRKTDQKKDRACRDAGLALVRWRVNAMPDVNRIRKALPETASHPVGSSR